MGIWLIPVFVAGILVGLAVFKDDWDTQRAKARDFLGGEWWVVDGADARYTMNQPLSGLPPRRIWGDTLSIM